MVSPLMRNERGSALGIQIKHRTNTMAPLLRIRCKEVDIMVCLIHLMQIIITQFSNERKMAQKVIATVFKSQSKPCLKHLNINLFECIKSIKQKALVELTVSAVQSSRWRLKIRSQVKKIWLTHISHEGTFIRKQPHANWRQ